MIRPAISTDAPAIAALAGELGYPSAPEAIAERLAAVSGRHDHAVLVFVSDTGTVDGWIHVVQQLFLEVGPRAEIAGLVVAARARGRGVGRTLVAAAEAWARGRGLPGVVVRSNVVRDASHPFYLSQGYERIKSQHVYRKMF